MVDYAKVFFSDAVNACLQSALFQPCLSCPGNILTLPTLCRENRAQSEADAEEVTDFQLSQDATVSIKKGTDNGLFFRRMTQQVVALLTCLYIAHTDGWSAVQSAEVQLDESEWR
jgi:hypothetical protein